MILIWLFLILMIVLNLASNWLIWNDTVLQAVFQFVSIIVIALVSFGLGMVYRLEKGDEDYPNLTKRQK